MKFVIRLTLLLVIAWAIIPSSLILAAEGDPVVTEGIPGYGTTILRNSDFEFASNDTIWSKWSAVNHDNIQIVESPVSSGNQAIRIIEEDLPENYAISGIHQTVPIRPNEWYTLKADILVQALDENPPLSHYKYNSLVTLQITFLDENRQVIPKKSKFIDVNIPSVTYNTKSISGISPPEAKYAKVDVHLKGRVAAGGGGTVYIDNVELMYDWAPRFLHHISGKTDSTIALAWTAPSDISIIDEYQIYRIVETVVNGSIVRNEEIIDTTETPSYIVTGLEPTTAYTFIVKAKTINGYVSIPSNEWKVATGAISGYTTIMPLGASMTDGYNVLGGFRSPLRSALDNLKVDFVGSLSNNAPASLIDREHEGHTGFRADQIANQLIDQQVLVYEPDIVLLFAGTNDMFDADQALTAHDDVELILSKITSLLPDTHVIVSSLTRIHSDTAIYDPRVIAHNNKVVQVVQSYILQDKNVSFVDMYPMITEEYFISPLIDPSSDLIHPNAAGFNKMSVVWHDAVHAIITEHSAGKNPTAPTNLQYVIENNNGVTLSWDSSTDNVGVTGYKVKLNETDYVTTENEYTVALEPDTAYTFHVTAIDAAGNKSAVSDEVTFTTEPEEDIEAPSTPTLVATALTQTKVLLSWSEATDNVGVKEYIINQDGSPIGSVQGAILSASVTNLTVGSTSTFTVIAKDAADNESIPSLEVSVTTMAHDPEDTEAPSIPIQFEASETTSTTVNLSWSEAEDNVGVTYYLLYSNGEYTDSAAESGIYMLSGLEPETEYTFTITAVDAVGNESAPSSPLIVTTLAQGDIVAPTTPLALAATHITTTSVHLSWTEATDNVGVTGYKVNMNGTNHLVTENEFNPIDLEPETEYTIQVIAVDAAGNESSPSNVVTVTTLSKGNSSLKQPTNLHGGTITTTSVNLIWDASADQVGATYYTVYVNNELHQSNITATTFTVTGLQPSTSYTFKVTATDSRGIPSPASTEFNYSTDSEPINTGNPNNTDNPGGVPFTASTPPIVLNDSMEYIAADSITKLRYVPNRQKAIDSLNSNNQALLLNIPSDKHFDQLELELSGEIIKLAFTEKKSIIIQLGDIKLQLPANFLELAANDTLTFKVNIIPKASSDSLLEQSLTPLSMGYDLELMINSKVISIFDQPIELTITPTDEGNLNNVGIYLYDPITTTWSYVGGRLVDDGKVSALLSHFSRYALLESTRTFTDITSHWARLDIEALAARQIISGMTADLFDPAGDVTRAQFAAMLSRALRLEATEETLPFYDVQEGSWYYSNVSAAYQAKIVSGVAPDQFAPDETITREQMAVMIINAYLFNTGETLDQLENSSETLVYTDVEQISSWALPYIGAASEMKLIFGAEGAFQPKNDADRSQAAAMIYRLIKLLDTKF
jgi:chitodextrinase/lysophospholipase L1-like esterase